MNIILLLLLVFVPCSISFVQSDLENSNSLYPQVKLNKDSQDIYSPFPFLSKFDLEPSETTNVKNNIPISFVEEKQLLENKNPPISNTKSNSQSSPLSYLQHPPAWMPPPPEWGPLPPNMYLSYYGLHHALFPYHLFPNVHHPISYQYPYSNPYPYAPNTYPSSYPQTTPLHPLLPSHDNMGIIDFLSNYHHPPPPQTTIISPVMVPSPSSPPSYNPSIPLPRTLD